MWITLCVTAYNRGFCCGMQRTVVFMQFTGCACRTIPYNAPPLTRHTGLRSAGCNVSRFEIIRTSELSRNKRLTDNAE
ncbi:hypothetical protein FD733_19740, partial [Pantoea sp. Eser]|nr:hypothetical protein [Pantoea sp. Eser]